MLDNIFQSVSYAQILLFVVGAYVVYDFIKKVNEDRKIRRLGARAPIRRSWVPFGIDIAYQGTMSVIHNKTYEYFLEGLKQYGNKNHPYTIEFHVGAYSD